MPKFYAYVYFDPRDGLPFYVGKGQGYRARKHLHQATNKGVAERIGDEIEETVEAVAKVIRDQISDWEQEAEEE